MRPAEDVPVMLRKVPCALAGDDVGIADASVTAIRANVVSFLMMVGLLNQLPGIGRYYTI